MTRTVLHVLSQRPGRTGSGITLEALVSRAAEAGWEQHAVVGTPGRDPAPAVGELPPERVHPLVFDRPPVEFPLPGMSDVMPYDSTRFSDLRGERLEAYGGAWREHLGRVIGQTRPDVVHVHHLWLVGGMVKDAAADAGLEGLPVVSHVHGTALRQRELASHLAAEAREGCRRNDRFAVLHEDHAERVSEWLDVPRERISVVGAGYREDLFQASGRPVEPPERLVYVGKLSAAKGLAQLLDAFEGLAARRPGAELHVAGSGGGEEGRALAERMAGMERVTWHGPLPQDRLGELLRSGRACVLPSFYEGLPLVLVEALACGCRLVATRLPGVESGLAPHLGEVLEMVDLPEMAAVDTPADHALPDFVQRLEAALVHALDAPPLADPRHTMPDALHPFTWQAVFERVERLWKELT